MWYRVKLRITIHRQACYTFQCAKNNDESIGLPGRSYEIIESSETFRASRQYCSTLVRNFIYCEIFLSQKITRQNAVLTDFSRPVRNCLKDKTKKTTFEKIRFWNFRKFPDYLWEKLGKVVLRDS